MRRRFNGGVLPLAPWQRRVPQLRCDHGGCGNALPREVVDWHRALAPCHSYGACADQIVAGIGRNQGAGKLRRYRHRFAALRHGTSVRQLLRLSAGWRQS